MLVLSATTVMAQVPPAAGGEDYLAPELRVRVDRLKAEINVQSSTGGNYRERAGLLWEWANAYALSGGVLPVDLPSTVARLAAGGEAGKGILSSLDGFIRELRLHDNNPDALGKLTTDTAGPFTPGSFVTIKQAYHFGSRAMRQGGGFFVARHFMSNQGRYQTRRPAADNYVSIKSSNAEAEFVAISRSLSGMHGGFRRSAPGLFFRLEQGHLSSGDTVTITYGDRSAGSRGFQVQTYSNDAFPLPLYIDLTGKRQSLTLPINTYRVTGGPVEAVKIFAPSIIKTGEPFSVSVRSEDLYYNRASGPVPAYRVSVNGEPFKSIPVGNKAITVLDEIRFEEPGVYRFSVESVDGEITGHGNPVWVRENPVQRIYWGDTHGHCGFAEGQGTPDAFFEFGRDDACLDFLTLSEHDLWMDDAEWQALLKAVDQYHVDGKFVTIPGYEWTVPARRGGHHNVFFRDTKERRRVPNQTAPVLSKLYRRLARENDMRDVLIIPHAHQPGDYRVSDPTMETLVEIMSMHGHFEWFGIMYLKHGHEVGFVAASDDHLSHPGYSSPLPGGLAAQGGLAAVMAPEKTRDAIFDAMKNLSAYATTGQRIILEANVNGAPMGTRTVQKPVRRVRGRVIGTAPIDEITIVRNGRAVWSRDVLGATSQPEGDQSQALEVRFHSVTDPGIHDSPRGWRSWKGTLQVEGAKLKGISSPAMQNRLTEYLRRDQEESSSAEFLLITRGSFKNLVLELEDVQENAIVEIDLVETRERSGSPSLYRLPASLPAERIRFALADMKEKKQVKEIKAEQFTDTVTMRRIRTDASLDQAFEFIDKEGTKPGDYYFVRVTQLDGGTAWASPVWVGGFSPRHEKASR